MVTPRVTRPNPAPIMPRMALDYTDGCAWVRGEYLPIAQACIPITDWGFLRSDATYDVVTAWEGAFFRLDTHLDRFLESCKRSSGSTPAAVATRWQPSWLSACAARACATPTSR